MNVLEFKPKPIVETKKPAPITNDKFLTEQDYYATEVWRKEFKCAVACMISGLKI